MQNDHKETKKRHAKEDTKHAKLCAKRDVQTTKSRHKMTTKKQKNYMQKKTQNSTQNDAQIET